MGNNFKKNQKMKTNLKFGKAILMGAVFGVASIFVACGSEENTEDTTDNDQIEAVDSVEVIEEVATDTIETSDLVNDSTLEEPIADEISE